KAKITAKQKLLPGNKIEQKLLPSKNYCQAIK
ncbi:MAG: hypothetical protein ACI9A1_001923, partial [Lentimonas sp.]